jgi:hypothetical protein
LDVTTIKDTTRQRRQFAVKNKKESRPIEKSKRGSREELNDSMSELPIQGENDPLYEKKMAE